MVIMEGVNTAGREFRRHRTMKDKIETRIRVLEHRLNQILMQKRINCKQVKEIHENIEFLKDLLKDLQEA